MSVSIPSTSTIRNLKDLRAAIRHGEAVTVRRVNSAVISGVATAVATLQSTTTPILTNAKSTEWQRVAQRAALARDAIRLSAAVAGIAAAVWLTGEIITTPALTMLALLPAIIVLAKSAECTAELQALRGDARRVEALCAKVSARRHWLTTVSRASSVLTRSLATPHALYETPHFGTSVRVMRRHPLNTADLARLHDALQRAQNVEHVIAHTRAGNGVDLEEVVLHGWTSSVLLWRRVLAAAALVALINTAIVCANSRPLASVIGGVACAALLGVRCLISSRTTRRIELTIRRQSMRLRYPDLLIELDNVLQGEIDRLIGIYANGLDVEIDPFSDLEPQLRRQVDIAIAYGVQNERQLQDVLDLRALRGTPRA